MKACKKIQQLIWLYMYDELSDEQKKTLKDHLKDCGECRLDFDEAKQMSKLFDNKIQMKPTKAKLGKSRSELHERLLVLTQPKLRNVWINKIKAVLTLEFSPSLRFATAMGMLVVGLILGRFLFVDSGEKSLKNLSSQLAAHNIGGVEFIDYDSDKNRVSLIVNSMNNFEVEGEIDKPEIQQLLARALTLEERPNIRLKTVSALSNTRSFEHKILDALIEVLEKDENSGIRLKTIKLLNAIPLDDSFKNVLTKVFVRVLLSEKNTAIRIEAINGLSKINDETAAPVYYNAARNDTNEYIRNKAARLIERIENPVIPE